MWVFGAAVVFFFALGIGVYVVKHARDLSQEQHFLPLGLMLWIWRIVSVWAFGFSGFVLYVIIRALLSC